LLLFCQWHNITFVEEAQNMWIYAREVTAFILYFHFFFFGEMLKMQKGIISQNLYLASSFFYYTFPLSCMAKNDSLWLHYNTSQMHPLIW
jgi:hypothetical protein